MAISISSRSVQLHFSDAAYKGHNCKQVYHFSSVTIQSIIQKEPSWSSRGVSKLLKLQRHNGSYSQAYVNRKSHIKAIVSCLRNGSTKYLDFVVIGSGVAGLRYAVEVAKHGTVAVITKAEPHESNTNYAQGGVSAVLCPKDSVENHMQDTVVAGAYLCDEETDIIY